MRGAVSMALAYNKVLSGQMLISIVLCRLILYVNVFTNFSMLNNCSSQVLGTPT
jgi:hypothetical protein